MQFPRNILPSDGGNSMVFMGITAMIGLFLVIIVYYIIVSRSANQAQFNRLYNMQMPIQAQEVMSQTTTGPLPIPTGSKYGPAPMPANAAVPTSTAAPAVPTTTKAKIPEVYNVKANIYTLEDAPAVCGALGGEVATIEQLIDAHKKGADWCNVGWTKDGLAAFPLQQSTWQTLQDSTGEENSCGSPGINLVRNDPNLLYGVNCYGPKPDPVGNEKVRTKVVSTKQAAINAKINELKRGGHIGILSFNADEWSQA